MADYLRISATFLDPRFHGRGDGGEPEWPPSPLRLMQAIVAANADRIGTDGPLDRAIGWLEHQRPPMILAPKCERGPGYCLSVPNNAMDLVGKAWAKGNYFGAGDSNPATHRTMKTVRPLRMVKGADGNNEDTVHYLWPLNDDAASPDMIDAIIDAARRMVALGWGVDLVVGDAERVNADDLAALGGERWSATPGAAAATLRTPVPGTLDALQDRHTAFISRMGDEGFVPVPPLTTFHMYTEMLAEGMVPDRKQQREYLDTLRAEAARLSHLVENVLSYARLERGRADGKMETVPLGHLVEPIVSRLADRARQASMELVVEKDDAVRALPVEANPSAVQQILFNLVDNACKYAAAAADRRIHVSLERAGGVVRIGVRDHGPGVSRRTAPRLFWSFSKSAHEAANSAPGIGLGLALSRRLARDMGGRLELDRNAREGARFVLTLAVSDAPAGMHHQDR